MMITQRNKLIAGSLHNNLKITCKLVENDYLSIME